MTDAKYGVVGIGNAIVDIIARCDEAFLSNHGMEKGFMQLIDSARADELYGHMGPALEQSGEILIERGWPNFSLNNSSL